VPANAAAAAASTIILVRTHMIDRIGKPAAAAVGAPRSGGGIRSACAAGRGAQDDAGARICGGVGGAAAGRFADATATAGIEVWSGGSSVIAAACAAHAPAAGVELARVIDAGLAAAAGTALCLVGREINLAQRDGTGLDEQAPTQAGATTARVIARIAARTAIRHGIGNRQTADIDVAVVDEQTAVGVIAVERVAVAEDGQRHAALQVDGVKLGCLGDIARERNGERAGACRIGSGDVVIELGDVRGCQRGAGHPLNSCRHAVDDARATGKARVAAYARSEN